MSYFQILIYLSFLMAMLPGLEGNARAFSAPQGGITSKEDVGDKDKAQDTEKEKEERPFDEDCPKVPQPPKITTSTLAPNTSVKEQDDPNAQIVDIGTDIVNNEFFVTPENYFNFLKIAYEGLDNAIGLYRSEKKLDEKAIFLIFKGGNVLRMVAYKTIGLLPLQASALLKFNYAKFFKRSDTDFAIYIDDKKLGELDFTQVFDEVSERVFLALGKIRGKLQSDPKKYFEIFGLEKEEAAKKMNKYFSAVKGIGAISDPKNQKWYKAKFTQLQLLDFRGNEEGPYCPYIGNYDYKYEVKDDVLTITPMSKEVNWIVNTDNRSVNMPWGADPKKRTRFSLNRAKVAIDYRFEKFGEAQQKPIGGELLDVSVIHKDDGDMRDFLDHYDDNVVDYKITLKSINESLVLQTYSIAYLAHDLRAIFFETYDRPWKMGEKYTKRVYRFFFLSIVEMLAAYGLGSEKIAQYSEAVKENLLKPMEEIYTLKKDIKAAKKIEANAEALAKKWPDMRETNEFLISLARVVSSTIEKPQEGDEEGIKELLKLIEKNLAIAEKLGIMPAEKFYISNIYDIDISDVY